MNGNVPLELVAGADGLCLLRSKQDAFGTPRQKSHYFIVAADDTALTGVDLRASNPVPSGELLKPLDAEEVFVICSNRYGIIAENIISQLQRAGFMREPFWPNLPLLSAAVDGGTIIRMSKCATASVGSEFERSYAAARSGNEISEDNHRLLDLLRLEIERATKAAVHETGFDATYGVLDVMHVGSASRGTYTEFPADFDVVVNTMSDRTLIDSADAERVCNRLIKMVEQSDAFKQFRTAVAKSRSWDPVGQEARVVLESFGARGPQSLVARYDLTKSNGIESSDRVGFLDLTFGRLPQLIGYEIWIRRLFGCLEPTAAERLRSEIRLAKSLLKQVPGIYGTPFRGLRAHAVEQWIIQSADYRASGLGIGTLSNALCLVVEEADTNADLGDLASFESYKTRFPLRHPGWWETEPESSDRLDINLWDLMGDGEAAVAEPKWQTLVALAWAFKKLVDEDSAWDVRSLVGAISSV